ncbi:uncharacterized protein K452DRAFT_18689 [Aplosporella prunicola CBS 121167]|uniref:Uncharacterized protein n=1 Tax=Aplosporella prunicola CBS 121167 TaxID=1176127 RepID=A0A6A6BGN6_9PEZI|nr:uncharacterized protein K452DRAFT_18689 [Aplosporella prunicola CBS 121167]KAF2142434.1 hypothetical protein K452DRAFT_18689 [Aplosporella prunicola CBS 121167]
MRGLVGRRARRRRRRRRRPRPTACRARAARLAMMVVPLEFPGFVSQLFPSLLGLTSCAVWLLLNDFFFFFSSAPPWPRSLTSCRYCPSACCLSLSLSLCSAYRLPCFAFTRAPGWSRPGRAFSWRSAWAPRPDWCWGPRRSGGRALATSRGRHTSSSPLRRIW